MMDCFTENNMIFQITNSERKEVELVNVEGVFGEIRCYGKFDNKLNTSQDLIIIPKRVYSNEYKTWFNVNSIGKSVFDCAMNVEKILLPDCLKNIEWGFWHCKKLKSIEIIPDAMDLQADRRILSVDGVLYNSDCTKLIAYPNMKGQEYFIPEGVVEINKFAFKDCNNLRILHLPLTIEKIGVNAFYRCVNLEKIFSKKAPSNILIEKLIGDYGNVTPDWILVE